MLFCNLELKFAGNYRDGKENLTNSAAGQNRTDDAMLFQRVDYIITRVGCQGLPPILLEYSIKDSLYTFPACTGLGSGLLREQVPPNSPDYSTSIAR